MVRESRREKERRRKNHRRSAILGVIAACAVLVMLAVAVAKNERSLRIKNKEMESQISELESQIEDETNRASDLNDKQAYMQSDKYIEEIAKSKFGLIYPDEIIFKANEK